MGVAQADGEAAFCHLGCEIENTKNFHAVRRYRVFIVNDSDVAKTKRLDQGLHDFVMRDRAVGFGCRRCGHQC